MTSPGEMVEKMEKNWRMAIPRKKTVDKVVGEGYGEVGDE